MVWRPSGLEKALYSAIALSASSCSPGIGHSSPPSATCVTRGSAFLRPAQLGDFTRFVDRSFNRSPLAEFTPAQADSPLTAGFSALRVEGFIATEALTGAYRANEDQRARALHYHLGRWPLVPLAGMIVRDNPTRALEIYQSNWSFRSGSAASAYMKAASNSARLRSPDIATPQLMRLGREVIAYRFQPPASHPGSEAIVWAAVQQGAAVITLGVQGGPRMTEGEAYALVRKALRRVRTTCPPTIRKDPA